MVNQLRPGRRRRPGRPSACSVPESAAAQLPSLGDFECREAHTATAQVTEPRRRACCPRAWCHVAAVTPDPGSDSENGPSGAANRPGGH